MGLENGALDCRSGSLRTLFAMESSRIAPDGWKQRAALSGRPAPVPATLSCGRDRRMYRRCVQSTGMVSGRDVRCRPGIRREVRPYLGTGVAQREQPSRGSGCGADPHSKELGVDCRGNRDRGLLRPCAWPGGIFQRCTPLKLAIASRLPGFHASREETEPPSR